MSNILTLFRDRATDPGSFHRRQARCGDADYCLYVYAKTGFKNPQLLNQLSFASQDQYEAHKNNIITALRKDGGGWLIDSAGSGQASAVIRIYQITGLSFGLAYTPTKCFCLKPDDNAIEEDFLDYSNKSQNEPVELTQPQGSHIILPVDKAAEESFVKFRKQWLTWFPDGFETAALSLLRQPSVTYQLNSLQDIIVTKMAELGMVAEPKPIAETDSADVSAEPEPRLAADSAKAPGGKLAGRDFTLSIDLKNTYVPFLAGVATAATVAALLYAAQPAEPAPPTPAATPSGTQPATVDSTAKPAPSQ